MRRSSFEYSLKWLLIPAVTLVASPAISQSNVEYVLEPSRVACLQEFRGYYEEITEFPAVVSLSKCPDRSGNPLLGLTLNEAPKVVIDRTLVFDPFVYLLDREELSCLLDASIGVDSTRVIFMPRKCTVEAVRNQ